VTTFRTAFFLPAITVVAFLCTCVAVHTLLPGPNIPEVSSKMRFFAAHKDEFDTIFVGSSRIYSGVSPGTFDQLMARAGRPSHSFNFGLNGMYPPESFYVVDQILSMKPRKLKRVFVELDDLHGGPLSGGQTSQRVLYWHDWKRTRLVLRKILKLDANEGWTQKLKTFRRERDTIALHLGLFAKNFSNVGRASDLAESSVGSNQSELDELGPKQDGYVPETGRISGEKLLDYEKELAREQADHLGNVAVDDCAAQAYWHFARQIRSAGATPIFFVTPIYPQIASRFSGPSPGLLLSYNNPTLYAGFYRPEVRANYGHLNATGAEEFTQLLVEDFLRNMDQP
jgi:hypothetical protein